ncbi:MAG: AAA domain-containing protein [Hyphomicrobiales bacterium]|nr:AAA domain-containing protein [Hyphomicrobiales bacterium]
MPDAAISERLSTVLRLSDDGYILLGDGGIVVDANEEASRGFGVEPKDLTGRALDTIPIEGVAWKSLVEACAKGGRTDLYLNLPAGRRVLASLRRTPHADAIELIKLCDLEIFDYRRGIAQGGKPENALGFMASNRTRPDFEVQRTLSPELHRTLSRGERAMQRGAPILVSGESGVGKSEVARFLHNSVARASDPFVSINCAVAANLNLASLLFGEDSNSDGAIYRAAGGTLFLDEIAEVPLDVQARLVGFLEDSILDAASKRASIASGTRLITATNRNLQELVKESRFRPDLYYRIAVVGLAVPPLRQTPRLIRHLTDRFLLTLNRRRRTPIEVPDRFREALDDYSFPGNIRELLNIVQKAAILIEDAQDMEELMSDLITAGQILPEPGFAEPATFDLKTEVKRFERALIDKAIRVHGSKRKAAKALGVDIGTVVRKTATSS